MAVALKIFANNLNPPFTDLEKTPFLLYFKIIFNYNFYLKIFIIYFNKNKVMNED